MAWISGWSYRKEISITGQSGAGTNFQVDFSIGDSAGGNFHLEGHCTNFPQDIEVTDNDGTTLLDYWIEDITADPLKMWVEVADDLGTNQTIYIYYGKSGATTNSNIEDTFIFGDDFPGTSIDTGKWTVTGTVGVSSSEATLNEDDILKSIATFGFETAVTAKVKSDEQDVSFVGYYTDSSNRTQLFNSDAVANDDFDNIMGLFYKDGSWESAQENQWSDFRNTYYQYTIERISTSLLKYSQGGNSNTYTNSTYIATGDMSAMMYVWDSSQASTLTCDWIYVRKCIDTEPAFSSAGSEETYPGHTFDTKSYTKDNSNPFLAPITPTAGATLLVVSIVVYTATARTGGAPSFNGETLTQVGTIETGAETNVEMWYLIDPSIGSYNVSIPNTNDRWMYVVSSVYKAQAGYSSEFDVSNGTNNTTANPSLSVTPTVNGDVIVDVMGSGWYLVPSANNQTLLYSTDEGSLSSNSQYALQSTAGVITFSWTVDADDWCMIVGAFKEVVSAVTGHPWFYERKQ